MPFLHSQLTEAMSQKEHLKFWPSELFKLQYLTWKFNNLTNSLNYPIFWISIKIKAIVT